MNIRLFNFIELIFTIFPIKNNRILFYSFGGQYNDNPLYVYKQLSQYKYLELIWIISDKSMQLNFPKDVKVIKYHSIRHAYYSRTAKVIVDNGAGYKNILKRKRYYNFIYKLYKRKNQFNLSTWHGTPMKNIGIYIPNIDHDFSFSTSDIIIAGCEYTRKILDKSFPFKVPVIITGTPRNDILVNFREDKLVKNNIKNKLNINENAKVILYAPTYRENPEYSGIIQMKHMDIVKLLHVLSKKFGGEWIFAYRIHQMSLNYSKSLSLHGNNNSHIVNLNSIDDMAECLLISDILISDFSGAIYDYALTYKPCFLYAIDSYNYIYKERGLNQKLIELPFSFSNNFHMLIFNIENFNFIKYQNKVKIFLNKIGNHEDGQASERVAKIIIKNL